MWAITHENGHKCKTMSCFAVCLQHVHTVIFLVNLHGTPKQWALANRNGHKMKKWWIFWHAPQTCTECHGPCKSVQNPKPVGNGSWKWP
jgi:hypothetical protein